MSHFLWVEDFERSPRVTTSNVFGGIFEDAEDLPDDSAELKSYLEPYGVFIQLSFQDAWEFIHSPKQMERIDYIVLDIDLPSHSGSDITENVCKILKKWHGYEPCDDEAEDDRRFKIAASELKKIAGYYLYIQLLTKIGFPHDHIIIVSDHGTENLKSIKDAFTQAKMEVPEVLTKSNPKTKKSVREFYDNCYSILRRGIIDGCLWLEGNLHDDDQVLFNAFTNETGKELSLDDIYNYLNILKEFLPLREPKDQIDKWLIYKLLIRTLAHEWDALNYGSVRLHKKNNRQDIEIQAFAKIMKMTRNWMAHGKIFEKADEALVAYLFWVNMRAMFHFGNDVIKQHERILLRVFNSGLRKPLRENDFIQKIGRQKDRDVVDRELPMATSYRDLHASIKKHNGKNRESKVEHLSKYFFEDMLNNAAKCNGYTCQEPHREQVIRGLYQLFWHYTSTPWVNARISDKNNITIDYKFNYYDYGSPTKNHVFELARHIYPLSFPD